MDLVLGDKLHTAIPVLTKVSSSSPSPLQETPPHFLSWCWDKKLLARQRSQASFGVGKGSPTTARTRECWKEDPRRGFNFTLRHVSSTTWDWRWTDPVSKLFGDHSNVGSLCLIFIYTHGMKCIYCICKYQAV